MLMLPSLKPPIKQTPTAAFPGPFDAKFPLFLDHLDGTHLIYGNFNFEHAIWHPDSPSPAWKPPSSPSMSPIRQRGGSPFT